VLKFEQEPPESFTPHPQFSEEISGTHPVAADKSPDDTGH
jgi:hypothetical protein